ncbi:hypothetical protein pb186bvf_009206 [Paramecium bursaria]
MIIEQCSRFFQDLNFYQQIIQSVKNQLKLKQYKWMNIFSISNSFQIKQMMFLALKYQ